MEHVCERCQYKTKNLANFKKHLNRKKPCGPADSPIPIESLREHFDATPSKPYKKEPEEPRSAYQQWKDEGYPDLAHKFLETEEGMDLVTRLFQDQCTEEEKQKFYLFLFLNKMVNQCASFQKSRNHLKEDKDGGGPVQDSRTSEELQSGSA